MKLLVIHPGANYSIHDVASGLVRALIAQGHQVGAYGLADRIHIATKWVDYTRRLARRNDPTVTMSRDERLNRIFDEAAKDVLAMALDNGVDGVLVMSAMFLPGQTLFRLRRAGIPTGLVLTESPYDDDRHLQLAPLADIVWTQERTSVPRLRAVQPQTYYLPAAYDPAVHTAEPQPGDDDVPAHDVVFVGTAFRERVELLAAVDWAGLGIDLGLYGNWSEHVGRWRSKERRALEPYIRGGMVNNHYAAALYRRAKIGLNLYRTSIDFGGKAHVAVAESLNPRAYELAACGCFQLSQWRAEIGDVMAGGNSLIAGTHTLTWAVNQYLGLDSQRLTRPAFYQPEEATFDARARQVVAQFEPVVRGQEVGLMSAYG